MLGAREDSLRSAISMNRMPTMWIMAPAIGEKPSALTSGTDADKAPMKTLYNYNFRLPRDE